MYWKIWPIKWCEILTCHIYKDVRLALWVGEHANRDLPELIRVSLESSCVFLNDICFPPEHDFILLMEEIRLTSWYGKYSIICRVSYMLGGYIAWFLNHQQYEYSKYELQVSLNIMLSSMKPKIQTQNSQTFWSQKQKKAHTSNHFHVRGPSLGFVFLARFKEKNRILSDLDLKAFRVVSWDSQLHPWRLTAGFHFIMEVWMEDHFPFFLWVICRWTSR